MRAVRLVDRGARESGPVRPREHAGQPPHVTAWSSAQDRTEPRRPRDHDHHQPTRTRTRSRTSIEGIPLQIQHVNVTTTGPDSHSTQPTAPDGDHGQPAAQRRRHQGDLDTISGHQLRRAEVRTQIHGLDSGENKPSGRCEPDREAGLPQRAAMGTDANIAKVKVELPKQLPSRLTTLQKACPSAQFEANPAACPAASIDRLRGGTPR